MTVLAAGIASNAVAADDDLAAKVDAAVATALAGPGAAGISVAIGRGDEIILAKGYGKADLENDVRMTERSVLRIASVTKQYTAAMIMQLIERGELSLDDPITNYVDYPVGEHVVTIRHLLNHTSGIPSYTSASEFWLTGAARELTADELLSYVRDKPFDFEPGMRFSYNNTGYYLLGMIIESITGESYADALQSMLARPLGLEYTRFDVSAEIIPHRARGYTLASDGLANAMALGMNNPGAAGGIMATASDMVRWKQALVAGRVVSADTYEQMIQPTVLGNGETEAYGFGLVADQRHDRPCVSHSGGIHGFSSVLMYFPDEDVFVGVLANSDSLSVGPVSMEIAAAALGIELDDAMLDLAIEPWMMQQIVGRYVLDQIGLEVVLSSEDDKLMVQATNQPKIHLLHQGDGTFRASFDASLRITFAGLAEDRSERAAEFMLHQGGHVIRASRVE